MVDCEFEPKCWNLKVLLDVCGIWQKFDRQPLQQESGPQSNEAENKSAPKHV